MQNQDEVGRKISRPIRREVRQRCGFGCVVCGGFPYEYHHMTPWAEVKRHDADNLTLLCTKHHREATGPNPLLPEAMVREANASPFNRDRLNTPDDTLHFSARTVSIEVGSSVFRGSGDQSITAITINGEPILKFRLEDGHYLLSARIYDRANRLLLRIDDNELTHSTVVFDVERVGNEIIIRTADREIALHLAFFPPDRIRVLRGEFWYSGKRLSVSGKWIEDDRGNRLSITTDHSPFGLVVWGSGGGLDRSEYVELKRQIAKALGLPPEE